MTFVLVLIYISFISLGLPDSLLGSAWTVMRADLNAPLPLAGILSLIVSCGTVVSSLLSTRMISRFGTAKVTAVSVAATALALLGFSLAPSFWMLCILAVPLGLGAGAVDAALNNYVALHFKARHMNWLHCFWGIGATLGPVVMSLWIARANNWRGGYATIALIQCALCAVLFASLPKWGKSTQVGEEGTKIKNLTLRETLRMPLAKAVLLSLFCYCALELTAGLWGASFLVLRYGISAQTAAAWISVYYFGITAGRFLSGFASRRWNNLVMIRIGQVILAAGVALILIPITVYRLPVAFCLIGLGCAPIYPSMLHQTPKTFGEANSQAMMGIQMASAYIGSTLMPPLFGGIAQAAGIGAFPFYLLMLVALMALCTEFVKRRYEMQRSGQE